MLTASDSELDKVVGLELGADDYVTKPFSLRELHGADPGALPALASRRSPSTRRRPPSTSAAVQVDLAGHRLLRDGATAAVKPKAFELLAFLLRHPGQVVHPRPAAGAVWGYDYAGETRTVDVHVHWLRSQIETDPRTPSFLHTVRGVGYVFRRPA